MTACAAETFGPLPPQQATLDLLVASCRIRIPEPCRRERGRGAPWCLGTVGIVAGASELVWALG